MSGGGRRAVRPTWVCGAEGEDDGGGDWTGLAENLKDGVAKKREKATQEEIEAQDETTDGEVEARRVKPVLDPKLPSAAEVREHQLTHLPYRSWCPVCVKGRGREADHRRRPHDEQGVPEYHLDYCFPGDEKGEKLTILIIVERYTKMKKGIVVPSKGSSGPMPPARCWTSSRSAETKATTSS